MATLYCDFENGNDNYAGSSFALLASGTNGRINSTTFSSTGASFPNDGSLINQYLSIYNGTIYAVYNITAWVSSTSLTIAAISGGTALANQTVDRQYYIGGRWKSLTSGATAARIAPGDEIRIMGSPAPTSLGQSGVWTSAALQGTKNISSSTNATPISVTVTAHGYSTGDTVVITGHTTNTNANGTWEITVTGANTFTLDNSVGNGVGGASGTVRLRNNTRVMLTTAVTQNIASTGPGRATWVSASAQGASVVTGFDTTNFKEHNRSDSIQIFVGATTGLLAYYTLPSTLDLSAYQQVSFWFFAASGSGNIDIELKLCSDTAGATAVNTIDVPIQAHARRWSPITVDMASNLGNNINSIGVYLVNFTAAYTICFSNIIACKASSAADSLSLTSLIGKNTTGETFWGIQSINGRRVMLDADTNATPINTFVRGYYGTSETVTTYKRETIKLGPATGNSTALQTIQDSGTDGSPITFSGGWDRTNMSTQSLETWLDGVNGNGLLFDGSRNFINLQKFAGTRFSGQVGTNSINNWSVTDFSMSNATTGTSLNNFFGSTALGMNVSIKSIAACNGTGFNTSIGTVLNLTVNGNIVSNAGNGIDVNSASTVNVSCKNGAIIANHSNNGLSSGSYCYASDVRTTDNAGGGVSTSGPTYFSNPLVQEANEVTRLYGSFLQSHNHDQTAGNHKIFMSGALISAATDQRKTASGISWKIQPTSTNRSSSFPVTLSLAKVAVAANSLVTVKAWMRRDNTGLTMRMVCKGGQIAGVTNDVVSAMTAAADTWEELTITFTPTEVGVVEITAEAWGGTTYSGWVDDMTISQA